MHHKLHDHPGIAVIDDECWERYRQIEEGLRFATTPLQAVGVMSRYGIEISISDRTGSARCKQGLENGIALERYSFRRNGDGHEEVVEYAVVEFPDFSHNGRRTQSTVYRAEVATGRGISSLPEDLAEEPAANMR